MKRPQSLYARHRDRVRAYAKAYRQANLEKARQRDNDYRDRNRDEINRRRRERYQARRRTEQQS
jgi:hypothetical protein